MRKVNRILAVLGIGFALTGCATLANWYDEFKANPAQTVQLFESTANTILSDLGIAWNFIQALIPAADLPIVTQNYQNGVVAVNHAETALNAGVTAAAIAQQSKPNLTDLQNDVVTAINNLIAIINQYGGNVQSLPDGGILNLTVAKPVPGLADALLGLQTLKNWK